MSEILSVKNISKTYGANRALDNVTFSVPEGSVFGILGPNGSGKTTMLGIVMDVLKANAGEFFWFGNPGGSPDQRKKIGSLLETPNYYTYLSALDNLKITQSISGRGNRNDIDEVLKKVSLYDRRTSSFKSYSLGMKQRLAIAAALLGNPQVLVLDEPTNGLDPNGIAEIRQLIVELKEKGHTIIMASHLLDEVEKVCTHVAILKKGDLLTSGNVEEILMDEDVVLLSATDLNQLSAALSYFDKKVSLDERNKTVQIVFPKGTADLAQLNRFCFDRGIVLTHLSLQKKKLETRFFELTNNN